MGPVAVTVVAFGIEPALTSSARQQSSVGMKVHAVNTVLTLTLSLIKGLPVHLTEGPRVKYHEVAILRASGQVSSPRI